MRLNSQYIDAGGGRAVKYERGTYQSFESQPCFLYGRNLRPTCAQPHPQKSGDVTAREGELTERNTLQLLSSAYNLQSGGGSSVELQEFMGIYFALFNGK